MRLIPRFVVSMFPKSVSGTSGKLQENKGDDINMSYDENPADNDPHGECRSEIHQLQNLLGQVYDQCGNHRAADRRHCLPPGLRDEIQGYLQAAGHRRAITEQENKGNDMAEESDKEIEAHRKNLQSVYLAIQGGRSFEMRTDSAHAQAIIWASERIAELEGQTQSPETGSDEVRDAFFCLGYRTEMSAETTAISYCEAVAWGQNRIRHLERERDERDGQLKLELEVEKAAYKRLEEENEQLELELKNISTISKSPDSDEEIYERRRRERLLDEVTLICVSRELEKMGHDSDDQLETGFRAREIASDIWAGINEFDLQV